MGYIIIWKHRHREPHVQVDSHNFMETYSTYEEAKEGAEETEEHIGSENPWYFDYAIFEEVDS